MASLIQLDTHVAAWLYAGDERRLRPVWRLLARHPLCVSPIVLLELQYLYEIGRTRMPAAAVSADLQERLGLTVASDPYAAVVGNAIEQTWTRDPFDRLIVGAALTAQAPLLTADQLLLEHCSLARWG